jgi:tetratricopeptide (TPR) repeat protein
MVRRPGRNDEALAYCDAIRALRPSHVAALEERVSILLEEERYEEAEETIRSTVGAVPTELGGLILLLHRLEAGDRHDEIINCCQQIVEYLPSYVPAYEAWVGALRSTRRFEDAGRVAAEAVAAMPGEPALQVAVARVHEACGRYGRALDACEAALKLDGGLLGALSLRVEILHRWRRFGECERAAREAIGKVDDDSALLLILGRFYDDRCDFDSALECLDSVLARRPRDADALIARSAVLRARRRYGTARREVERLLRERPYDFELQAALAWIQHDARQDKSATKRFKGLLRQAVNERERAVAHHGLGWVAFSAGKYSESEEEFLRAREEMPDNEQYELAWAWSLLRSDSRFKWEEAFDRLSDLADIKEHASILVCLGVAAFKLEDLHESQHYLERALEVDPVHGSHSDLGDLYAFMGRFDKAEDQFRKAIQRDWNDSHAHASLGMLYMRADDERLRDAESEFRQAQAGEPGSVMAAIGMARFHLAGNDEQRAEAVLRGAAGLCRHREAWQLHAMLAHMLIRRSEGQQLPDLLDEAISDAKRSIKIAPGESEPYYLAGVAQYLKACQPSFGGNQSKCRSAAAKYFRECVKRNDGHTEARRCYDEVSRRRLTNGPSRFESVALMCLVLPVSVGELIAFYQDKISLPVLISSSAILLVLFMVVACLPMIRRFKLPGIEVEFREIVETGAPGPTGELALGAGHINVIAGPSGQLPRRV